MSPQNDEVEGTCLSLHKYSMVIESLCRERHLAAGH